MAKKKSSKKKKTAKSGQGSGKSEPQIFAEGLNSSEIANWLREQTIPEVIERCVSTIHPYDGDIERIDEQLMQAPKEHRGYLQDARKTYQQLNDESMKKTYQEIAQAIVTIANEYKIPVDLQKKGKSSQSRQSQGSNRPPKQSSIAGQILEYLNQSGKATTSQLKENIAENDSQKTQVSGQLSAMKRKGWVEQLSEEEGKPYVLTEQGQQIAQQLR